MICFRNLTPKRILIIVTFTIFCHTYFYSTIFMQFDFRSHRILSSWNSSFKELHLETEESSKSLTHKLSALKTKQEFENWHKEITANIPIDLLHSRAKFSDPKKCTKFPDLYDLAFNNIYWQALITQDNITRGHVLSAYYDNRELVENRPIIRIIAVLNAVELPYVKYCQIWFKEDKKLIRSNVTSPISTIAYPYPKETFILSCEVPKEYMGYIPAAVSLVENECDLATNVLKVNYNLPMNESKEDFAICIKAIYYPHYDISFYLVEYIELAKLMGVQKLYIYVYDVHPNISSVLRYYESLDQVQVIPLTLPGTRPNLYGLTYDFMARVNGESVMYERLPHNDCFYRNIYRYNYIAFNDMDEIMIPNEGRTWKQQIYREIKKDKESQGSKYEPPSVYLFQGASKHDAVREPFGWAPDIPKYMTMLQNVYRTPFGQGYSSKQIVDTERNLGISNHRPQRCIGECIKHHVPNTEAYFSHFRKKGHTNMPTKDTQIWHYKDKMIENVEKTLKIIGLI